MAAVSERSESSFKEPAGAPPLKELAAGRRALKSAPVRLCGAFLARAWGMAGRAPACEPQMAAWNSASRHTTIQIQLIYMRHRQLALAGGPKGLTTASYWRSVKRRAHATREYGAAHAN